MIALKANIQFYGVRNPVIDLQTVEDRCQFIEDAEVIALFNLEKAHAYRAVLFKRLELCRRFEFPEEIRNNPCFIPCRVRFPGGNPVGEGVFKFTPQGRILNEIMEISVVVFLCLWIDPFTEKAAEEEDGLLLFFLTELQVLVRSFRINVFKKLKKSVLKAAESGNIAGFGGKGIAGLPQKGRLFLFG